MIARRRLGRSGLEISAVGLGTWAIGGAGWRGSWGPQEDADSLATMRRAHELGVNWIDTAAVYGRGHAEQVVGAFLAELPDSERPFVFTKCGRVIRGDAADAAIESDLRPEAIRRDCEASLRRLGVERIDLLQVHHSDPQIPTEDAFAVLLELVSEGKVRCAGVCNQALGVLGRAGLTGRLSSHQNAFSLFDRTSAECIAFCREADVGVLAYGALHHGLLTDGFSPGRVERLADDDWRRRQPRFHGDGLLRSLRVHEQVAQIAARSDQSIAALAIDYVLDWPGVSGVIVGARKPDQLEPWTEVRGGLQPPIRAALAEVARHALPTAGPCEVPERSPVTLGDSNRVARAFAQPDQD